MKSILKLFGWGGYYLFAQFLPSSTIPFLGKISRTVRLLFCKLCFLQCGRNVNVERRAYFGFNSVVIGDESGIGPNFHLQGASLIMGQNILMGPNVTILGSGHRYERKDVLIAEQGNYPKGELSIGDDVWIGRNVTILPSCHRIGTGAVIGACSVLTHDVPEYEIWAGNPAKMIKKRK